MPTPRFLDRCGLIALVFLLAACSARRTEITAIGDPDRGALIVDRQACGSCHTIPGRLFADALAGPPLTHFARRTIIAGLLPNTPPNLVRWLRSPQTVVPGNAMPDVGLSETQARDVAAYLYTLR